MPPYIRRANLNDGPVLCEMAARFIETTVYAQFVAWTPEALADLVRGVLEEGVVFVVEVDGGQLVGMIALMARIHPMNGSVYADELAWWVEPAHRGSGAADLLLYAAEHWARENRLTVLKMVAPAGSSIGKHYLRLGFELVECTYQKTL